MVRVYEQVDVAAIDGSITVCTALSAASSTYDRELQESGTLGSGTHVITTKSGVDQRSIHLESEANEPGETSWPLGLWGPIRINVTTGNSNVIWSRTDVCRIDSGGTSQGTIGTETTDVGPMTAGVKFGLVSGGADVGAVTDRFYILGTIRRASGAHGNQSVTITNDQQVDTPFAASGAAVKDPVMSPGVVPFAR